MCLHSTSAAAAVLLWPEVAAGGVAQLVWSPTRPACFYVLDAACTLHHFDLTQVTERGQGHLRVRGSEFGRDASALLHVEVCKHLLKDDAYPHKQLRKGCTQQYIVLHMCAQSLSGPVTSEAFMGQSAGGVPSLTTTLAAAGLHPNGKVADVVPCFALGYDDGGVDVHVMSSRHATCASPDGEMMKLVEILGVKVAS